MFSFAKGYPKEDYSHVCSSIVPGMLYVSGMKPANDVRKLEELQIRHVIRLGDKMDLRVYADHAGIEYHTIEIEDSVRCHLTPAILDDALAFIKGATTPVLIHCYSGVSRSATVAMAYMIKVHGMSYQDAKKHVKEMRPCADPNTTFLKDLHSYWKH